MDNKDGEAVTKYIKSNSLKQVIMLTVKKFHKLTVKTDVYYWIHLQ